MKTSLLSAGCLILSGCTMTYTDPALPTDHPANPDAAVAAPLQSSRTLEISAVERAGAAAGASGDAHTGHRKDGMSMPQPPAKSTTDAQPQPPSQSPAAALFACPMHPEVTSDKPDQRCSKCGMKLKASQRQPGGSQ